MGEGRWGSRGDRNGGGGTDSDVGLREFVGGEDAGARERRTITRPLVLGAE